MNYPLSQFKDAGVVFGVVIIAMLLIDRIFNGPEKGEEDASKNTKKDKRKNTNA